MSVSDALLDCVDPSITCRTMRFIVLICGLWISAEGTAARLGSRQEVISALYGELTSLDIEIVCSFIKGKRPFEAGTWTATHFMGTAEGVPDRASFGMDIIQKCVRATCPEAIPSLARAIAVHDPEGTAEGITKAIGMIGRNVAVELYEYTKHLTALETADLVLDLYARARIAGDLGDAPLVLSTDDTKRIGVESWNTFYRWS